MNYQQTKLIALICLFASLLMACDATTPKKPEAEPVQPAAAVEPVEEQLPSLTTREHIGKALELFENGQLDDATQHLRQARERNPRNQMVKKLLKQLETDPQAYFGKEYFEYLVRKGDTLSALAQRFLGDEMEFIALTRYNHLAKPSLLEAGQTLRIPGKARPTVDEPKAEPEASAQVPSEAVNPEVVADVPSDESDYEIANGLYEKGDFAGTIEHIETAYPESPPPEGPLRQLLLNAYGAEAGSLIAGERWEAALGVLKKADALSPGDQSVAKQRVLVENGLSARALFGRGQVQRRNGDMEGAHASFRQAAELRPDDPDYAFAEKQTRTELAESYHRKALSHYRRQQLDEAQVYWEKVLSIDPDNKIAPGYLSKVAEIKQRLQDLDAN